MAFGAVLWKVRSWIVAMLESTKIKWSSVTDDAGRISGQRPT